jgi:hypothetical protein
LAAERATLRVERLASHAVDFCGAREASLSDCRGLPTALEQWPVDGNLFWKSNCVGYIFPYGK